MLHCMTATNFNYIDYSYRLIAFWLHYRFNKSVSKSGSDSWVQILVLTCCSKVKYLSFALIHHAFKRSPYPLLKNNLMFNKLNLIAGNWGTCLWPVRSVKIIFIISGPGRLKFMSKYSQALCSFRFLKRHCQVCSHQNFTSLEHLPK